MLRFDNEVHRIYGVMNLGLHKKKYLAAGEYTIADMICYPWATTWQNRNLDLNEFPNVKRWLDEIGERPAVKKAMAAGPEYREDPASVTPKSRHAAPNCLPISARKPCLRSGRSKRGVSLVRVMLRGLADVKF